MKRGEIRKVPLSKAYPERSRRGDARGIETYRITEETAVTESSRADLKIRNHPNEGIWKTGIKTLIVTGAAILFCPLMYILPAWEIGQQIDLRAASILGTGIAVLIGFSIGGGFALVQHFALRWVLFCHGKIPRNYAIFPIQASEAGILKQSGGRFRFYHDKLREHLAQSI